MARLYDIRVMTVLGSLLCLILGLAFTRMSDEEQAALHKRHPRGGRGERILEPPAAATP